MPEQLLLTFAYLILNTVLVRIRFHSMEQKIQNKDGSMKIEVYFFSCKRGLEVGGPGGFHRVRAQDPSISFPLFNAWLPSHGPR